MTCPQRKESSFSTVLEEICSTITPYTLQGPLNHRYNFDKTEFLHDVVIGAEWAKPVLTQSLAFSAPWTFQQLYTALKVV